MCSINWLDERNRHLRKYIMLKTQGTNAVMLMFNLTKYSNNYSKTSWSLWQYCKDKPFLDGNVHVINFNKPNPARCFNFKVKIIN